MVLGVGWPGGRGCVIVWPCVWKLPNSRQADPKHQSRFVRESLRSLSGAPHSLSHRATTLGSILLTLFCAPYAQRPPI